jgi:hypothetical protein
MAAYNHQIHRVRPPKFKLPDAVQLWPHNEPGMCPIFSTGRDSRVVTGPCDLEISLATYTLVNGTEAYKTLNNVSTANRLFTGYSRGQPYVFIGDADSSNNVDFSTSTVAVGVECTPISKSCNLSAISTAVTYHCSDNFTGDLSIRTINGSGNGGTTWRMNFFNDSKLTQPTRYK